MQTHHKASEASGEVDISDTREKPGRSGSGFSCFIKWAIASGNYGYKQINKARYSIIGLSRKERMAWRPDHPSTARGEYPGQHF